MQRDTHTRFNGRLLGELAFHGLMLVAALAIAFSMPTAIQHFVEWWPRIYTNPQWLLASQITMAALLFLLFRTMRQLFEARDVADSAKVAALVHARERGNWLSRWRERLLLRSLPVTGDCYILTVTGYDTFVHSESQFRQVLDDASEIQVMLLNPMSEGARMRADSLSNERDYYGRMLYEIHESIAHLKELRRAGKKVTLRFYNQQPFWKLVIVGEYVWVQYCHEGFEVNAVPEYVFALQSSAPERGLFTPFSMMFLEKWNGAPHLDFDFETDELVQRDEKGNELNRTLLPRSPHASKRLAVAKHSQCALTGYIPGQA